MSMLHVNVPAVCPCPCCLFKSMLHGHGHAAKTWACSTEMAYSIYWDMQYGYGHPAWTWTCSMNMDMQHEHEHGQKACTCSCCMFMSIYSTTFPCLTFVPVPISTHPSACPQEVHPSLFYSKLKQDSNTHLVFIC
jgi:hypothetical protein